MADFPCEFQPGMELTAELLTKVLKELCRWRQLVAAAPLVADFVDGPEPPILWSAASGGGGAQIGYTGPSGIPARSGTTVGSATVTLVTLSGTTLTTTTQTFGALNLSTSAVGGSKYIVCVQLGTQWLCIWEDCG